MFEIDQISEKASSDLVSDSLDYRGVHLDFSIDPFGKQYYTVFNNNRIDFGTDNTLYLDDAKLLIDDQLDTISRFSENSIYTGTRLTWFDNGGFRDIKLMHWNRIIKVYLIADPTQVNLERIKMDAKNIMNKLLEEKK